jgi:hypothetical protein
MRNPRASAVLADPASHARASSHSPPGFVVTMRALMTTRTHSHTQADLQGGGRRFGPGTHHGGRARKTRALVRRPVSPALGVAVLSECGRIPRVRKARSVARAGGTLCQRRRRAGLNLSFIRSDT